MRAVLFALILATPTLAEPIPGSSDPAFRAPFERALQGDDPTALLDLHAVAEAGNTAALLALPQAQYWLRNTVPFTQRKVLGRVNGTPLAEAYAAAHPTAALWAMGDPGTDNDALLTRAFALYRVGEPDKATFLFSTWLNQTGGFVTLPPDFFDQPVPPWAIARLLQLRLQDTEAPPVEAEALIIPLLKADNPGAWTGLAAYAGLNRPDYAPLPQPTLDRIARIIQAAGLSPDDGARKMKDAASILAVMARSPETKLDPAIATAATAAFRSDPTFQPLLTVCATACPQTQDQCTTAFVSAFGHPFGRATLDQPLTALISTEDFFATPRGRLLLLRSTRGFLGDDPAGSPSLQAVRDIDACLADAVLAALP